MVYGCEVTTGSHDQREVIAFLSDPKSYSGEIESSTDSRHMAHSFSLPAREHGRSSARCAFLSTLERRRVALRREFEINQSLPPEIYIGVVPITRGELGKLHCRRQW